MDETVEHLVSNVIAGGGQRNEEVAVSRVLSSPGMEVRSSVFGSFLNIFSTIHFIRLFGHDRVHALERHYHFCGRESEVWRCVRILDQAG